METSLRLAVIAAALGTMVGALWPERTRQHADTAATRLAAVGAMLALALSLAPPGG